MPVRPNDLSARAPGDEAATDTRRATVRLRTNDISSREMGGEVIVFDLKSSRYLSVTGVGVRLFELLGQERTLDELVDAVGVEYDVAPETARRDAERFVEKLRVAGLLED